MYGSKRLDHYGGHNLLSLTSLTGPSVAKEFGEGSVTSTRTKESIVGYEGICERLGPDI